MTRVTFYRSAARDGYRGYEACGHAQEIAEGEVSLVCAAVSTLAITGANALVRVAGIEPIAEERDGLLTCFLPEGLTQAQWTQSQTVLQTILSGLKDVASSYPAHVTIQEQ